MSVRMLTNVVAKLLYTSHTTAALYSATTFGKTSLSERKVVKPALRAGPVLWSLSVFTIPTMIAIGKVIVTAPIAVPIVRSLMEIRKL